MKSYYAIQRAEAGKSADIYIFGNIARPTIFEDGISADSIAKQIKDLDVEVVNVHIDSYGGSVAEGWGIYNALRAHPATVNTYGDGFVASSALYPFLAGDNRYASSVSAYYLHQAMGKAAGYAGDLRAAADEVDFFTKTGIQAFVERAGMEPAEVQAMMEAETWLTPAQALETGIATAIIQDPTPRYVQDAKRDIIQRFFPAAPKAEPQIPAPQQKKTERNKILQLFERSETK